MNKKPVTRVLLISVLLMTTVAVINLISQRPSLLAGSTCELPCWNQVRPGQTNQAELLRILANLPSVDPKSILHQKMSGNTFYDEVVDFTTTKTWTGFFYRNTAEAWFLNGKVAELTFRGEMDLTLAKAIETFGTPDHAFAFQGTEAGDIDTKVFFKNKGIVVGFRLPDIEAEIKPEQILLS